MADPISVRTTFGHDAASLDGVCRTLALTRPVMVSKLAELYTQDRVFDEEIATSDGTALGGHHTLTVRRDGSYRYQGHFRATGWPSYDVTILTTLGYGVSLPGVDGAPVSGQIAFPAHGRVHGTNESGNRVYEWDWSGASPLLASEWHGVRLSHLNHFLEYDTNWFGPAGDVVSFLGQVVAFGATLGAAGVAIVLAGEAVDLLDLQQLALPGMVGVLMAGGAAYVFGPLAMVPAFVVGAVVTAELITQRPLSPGEIGFARGVFGDKLRYDKIMLTNLVGVGDRPFTFPVPGGTILLNLGEGIHSPITYRGHGGRDLGAHEAGHNAPGGLLIHELTHAWQIQNESFTPEYYCRAGSTAAASADGSDSDYYYGPATIDWNSFGTEQQASIVEHWFGGNDCDDKKNRQIKHEPMSVLDDDDPMAGNEYYRYIRDNILTGIS